MFQQLFHCHFYKSLLCCDCFQVHFYKSILMTDLQDRGIKIDAKDSDRNSPQEIELSESDIEIKVQHLKKEKQNQKKKTIFIVLAIIVVLVCAFLVGFFTNYESALKPSQQEEVQKSKIEGTKKEQEVGQKLNQQILQPVKQIKDIGEEKKPKEPEIPQQTQKQEGSPQQQTRNQISKEQGRYIPGFACKAQYFQNWKPTSSLPTNQNGYRHYAVPYPQLVLVQRAQSASPDHHFPEIVSYVNKKGVTQSIFVHSGPIYPLLVLAASVSQAIPIFVSSNYNDKDLLKTCFAFNKIEPKLIFIEKKDEQSKIESSDLIVSSDSQFTKKNTKKRIMLIVETELANPYRELTYKVEPSSYCYPPKMTWDWRKTLTKGIYMVSQQCKII